MAIAFLTVERHDLVDRHAARQFDLLVQLEKGKAKGGRCRLTERRLAGASEPMKANAAGALFGGMLRLENCQNLTQLRACRRRQKQ